MQKLSKIFLAFALVSNLLIAPVLAAEFDPIADLAADTTEADSLLGLDLPSDLGEVTPILDIDIPTAASTIPSSIPIITDENFELGSGGVIDIKKINPTQPTSLATSGEIISVSYAPHAQVDLTPTGPEAAWAIALLLALPLAWIWKKQKVI
jgi:hypothetical protein